MLPEPKQAQHLGEAGLCCKLLRLLFLLELAVEVSNVCDGGGGGGTLVPLLPETEVEVVAAVLQLLLPAAILLVAVSVAGVCNLAVLFKVPHVVASIFVLVKLTRLPVATTADVAVGVSDEAIPITPGGGPGPTPKGGGGILKGITFVVTLVEGYLRMLPAIKG